MPSGARELNATGLMTVGRNLSAGSTSVAVADDAARLVARQTECPIAATAAAAITPATSKTANSTELRFLLVGCLRCLFILMSEAHGEDFGGYRRHRFL